MLTILNSMVIMIMGDLIWSLNDHRNLHFDNWWDIHLNCENYEPNDYGHDFGFANLLVLIVRFTFCEKWVQREKHPNNTHLP